MMPLVRIFRSGELVCETVGGAGETLLARIGAAGVFLDAPCGGQGKCGKCLVRLGGDGRQVLACRTIVDGVMDVYLPDDMEMKIAVAGADAGTVRAAGTPLDKPPRAVSDHMRDKATFEESRRISVAHPQDGKRLGVAVDIGTTTVVAHLTDINTGERLATSSGVNAQRPFGADVISRIQYCADNGHETLARIIREQLSKLIRNACAAVGKRSEDIEYISIAANTIMGHLAAGYSPVGMGVVPFTTVSLFGDELAAGDDLHVAKNAKAYFAPAISAYVGGDITAGMLAAGIDGNPGPVIFLDIGTNGEIALKSGDKYYCCATAAGPAFEGAEIAMGMAAVSGAINHVKWDGGLDLSVIGGTSPSGLCGSGLLDALAVLLETGAVDDTGRMLDPAEIEHEIAGCMGKIDGKNVFKLTKDGGVHMTAADIRKLQLAKSAIAAGIQTLLRHTGIAEGQVKLFVLAGGFGSFMDQYSAARIGLFPRCFVPVAKTLGNTAGEGAALALCSEDTRALLENIRGRCEYIELSSSAVFNEQFVEQMMFSW
jgi:uncharacterized 2Fe-2S/4Fe-4S cluster protein (DUF4445 family)